MRLSFEKIAKKKPGLLSNIKKSKNLKMEKKSQTDILTQALPARSSTGKGFVVEVPVFLRPSPVPISKYPELMGKPPVFIYTQQKMRVRARRACFLLHRQNHSDVTYRWPNLAGFRNMHSSYLC